MKKALSLFLALILVFSSGIMAFGQTSDYANSWARGEINYMMAKGILNGYPDGTFRPKNNITRAEIAALITRIK